MGYEISDSSDQSVGDTSPEPDVPLESATCESQSAPYRMCAPTHEGFSVADYAASVACEGFISNEQSRLPSDSQLTRKEALILAVQMIDEKYQKKQSTTTLSFSDIPAGNSFYSILQRAYEHDLITSTKQDFSPERLVTRSEAYSLIIRSVCMDKLVPRGSDQWTKYIYEIASRNKLTDRSWDDFRPDRPIYRSEMYIISALAADWADQNNACESEPAGMCSI